MINKKAIRRTFQATMAALLTLLFIVTPVAPAAADLGESPLDRAVEGGLLSAVKSVFHTAQLYLKGELTAAPTPSAHQELALAVDSLARSASEILQDERLVAALDEIIWGVVESEEFTEGIEDIQDLIASILRDERLIGVLGDVIAEHLQDERTADDIRYIAGLIIDLIAHPEIQFFVRDTIARLLESPDLNDTITGVMEGIAELVYYSGIEIAAGAITDERVPETIEELVTIYLEAVPELIAAPLTDERVKDISREITVLMMSYGKDRAADLLTDERFLAAVDDFIYIWVGAAPRIIAEFGADFTNHLWQSAVPVISDGTIGQITADMINEFLKDSQFQSYMNGALLSVTNTSKQRAWNYTPTDRFLLIIPTDIRRQVAEGLAEIPSELARLGFFTWLVYGNAPGLNVGTYDRWAKDVLGVVLNRQSLEEIGEGVNDIMRPVFDDFMAEHHEVIIDAMRLAVQDLPWEEISDQIRNDESFDEAAQIVAASIMGHLPLSRLAAYLTEDDEVADLFKEIAHETIFGLPFQEAGEMLWDDTSILELINGVISEFSLTDVARVIREDEDLRQAIADVAASFPVETIIDFVQDETRARLIGHTLVSTVLNIAADFAEDERMSDFAHGVIINIIGSLDSSPGRLVTELLQAAVVDNQVVTDYLTDAIYGFHQSVGPEVRALYKEAVPSFFTRFIWRFI